jgi:hypothetical protein
MTPVACPPRSAPDRVHVSRPYGKPHLSTHFTPPRTQSDTAPTPDLLPSSSLDNPLHTRHVAFHPL